MSMDRNLEPAVRRWAVIRRLAVPAAAAALLGAAFLLLPGWLRPSISWARIRTERVERGPVEDVIAATGTVEPASEQVVSSPLEARVVRIQRRAGAVVAAGDVLVQLDSAALELERRELADQIEQKGNQQEQLRLSLEKSLAELQGSIETKTLDAALLESRADESRRLAADGLISAATLRGAEVEARKARIEARQLNASAGAARRLTEVQLAAVALERRVLAAQQGEVERQLALATCRAGRSGVLTWMLPNEGATVHRGDVLARIADLGTFRVEATMSDIHSARLHVGQPVRVLADDVALEGRLAAIRPQVEDGAVKFAVDLGTAAAAYQRLRAHLRVDVLVIAGRRAAALRLRKGPGIGAAGSEDVFVIKGRQAVRRRVSWGLAGYEYVEVAGGLAAGDEVIVSDMKDYADVRRLTLQGGPRP